MAEESTILTGQGNTGTGEGAGEGEGAGNAAGNQGEGQEQGQGGQAAGEGQGAAAGEGEGGGEGSGEGEGQGEGQGEGEGEGEQGAPETYEDFTLPEGMELDPESSEQFKATAKEMNLTQEQAQKLVDLQGQVMAKQQEQLAQTVEQWKEDVKNDPEIGGPNMEKSVQEAQKALAAYGTDGLKDMLNQSGLGNHPEVVKFFAKVGRTLKEDTAEDGAAGKGNEDKTLAEALYG